MLAAYDRIDLKLAKVSTCAPEASDLRWAQLLNTECHDSNLFLEPANCKDLTILCWNSLMTWSLAYISAKLLLSPSNVQLIMTT